MSNVSHMSQWRKRAQTAREKLLPNVAEILRDRHDWAHMAAVRYVLDNQREIEFMADQEHAEAWEIAETLNESADKADKSIEL